MSSENAFKQLAIAPRSFQTDLLAWYDTHKRIMPWRISSAGKRSDPYHVWLSEVMLQQTTVAAVHDYFLHFINAWPDIYALANADRDAIMQAWAGLGYYTRARNLHKCAKMVVDDYDGQFPADDKELQKLPGIGPYTAAAIAAIAFDHPAIAIDGNVERVGARLFNIKQPLPHAKPHIRERAGELYAGVTRPGDFVQAMMELGATICRPKSPQCLLCPVRRYCHAFANGTAEQIPYRQAKQPRPQKYGYVYIIQNQTGAYLLETRPQDGLLGGMPGLPLSGLEQDMNACIPPLFISNGQAETKILGNQHYIMHSFTHFDLKLFICTGVACKDHFDSENYFWTETINFVSTGFPRLFQKVVQHYNSL